MRGIRTCPVACAVALIVATGAQADGFHTMPQIGSRQTTNAISAVSLRAVSQTVSGLKGITNVGRSQATTSPARKSTSIMTVVDDAGTGAAWTGAETTSGA